MFSQDRLLGYGYVLVSALFVYWLLLDAYLYIAVLVFLHVAYRKLRKQHINHVDPHGRAVLVTGCDTGECYGILLSNQRKILQYRR